jgi:hypothetical protein
MAAYRSVLLLLCAACAWGGVVYTFEPSPASSPYTTGALSGQQGWYVPTGTPPGGGSYSTGQVYSYASTGVPVAPGGGAQFVAMVGPGTSNVHSESFAGSSEWAITYDVGVYDTNPDYMAGSLNLYSAAGGQFQAVATLNSDSTWNAQFPAFDSQGNPLGNGDAGTGFDNLSQGQWYQEQIVFGSNSQIISVSINGATYYPTGWYFHGGAHTLSVTGIGLLSDATSPNNGMLFDNISLDAVPEPASWSLWLTGVAALCCLRGRRR